MHLTVQSATPVARFVGSLTDYSAKIALFLDRKKHEPQPITLTAIANSKRRRGTAGNGPVRRPPPGFKVDFKDMQQGQAIVELVPEQETVEDWTQMVTLQGFQNAKPGIAAFRSNMANSWLKDCPAGSLTPLSEGEENGYPQALWQLRCPTTLAYSGKPENAWVKAVQGQQGFYVKQYAFRYEPSQEEIAVAIGQLRDFYVCDNSEQHPCAD